jgi:hypothetical protein
VGKGADETMKRITIILLVLVAAIFSSQHAQAGPFGLEMGMKLEAIGGGPEELKKGFYKIKTVPKPHTAFETYIVQVGQKTGLCYIKAVGKDVTTNVYGVQLESAFEEMEAKVAQTYGKHDKTDLLMPGSIWKEPQDFMMGLLKKDRMLAAVWSAKYGSQLTENLKAVSLMAYAQTRNTGHLGLEYQFTNEKDCDTEVSAEEDRVL